MSSLEAEVAAAGGDLVTKAAWGRQSPIPQCCSHSSPPEPQPALEDSQSLKIFSLRADPRAAPPVLSCISVGMGVPKGHLETFNVFGSRSTENVFSTNNFFFFSPRKGETNKNLPNSMSNNPSEDRAVIY